MIVLGCDTSVAGELVKLRGNLRYCARILDPVAPDMALLARRRAEQTRQLSKAARAEAAAQAYSRN